jgi:uncharacterized repeat protein (TIGR04076 family)
MAKRFHDVRITVLKRLEFPKLFAEYAAGSHSVCTMTRDGQQYVSKGCEKPAGLCSWAWLSMQPKVAALALGSDFPWARLPGTEIFSCSDGLHPVIYKLERIDDNAGAQGA